MHYVDSNKEINKHFIKFVECDDGMTGEALAKSVEDVLDEIGLPLSQCRGQGYDGASAMSSEVKGVSGRILKKNPKALYIHCSSHRLNLVVAKTCDIQSVKNMSQAQKISSFFSPSPKRTMLLKEKMKEVCLKHQKLGAPSTTPWVERVTNLDEFVDAFEVLQLAASVGVKEKLVQICSVQTTWENYPVETAHDCYRLKLTIPILVWSSGFHQRLVIFTMVCALFQKIS